MTANPFAALLDGVRRYSYHDYDDDDGFFLRENDVLAALAAAYPADLAEAGEIAEQLLREADGFSVRASDTITALLARLAAQEAQMKELEERVKKAEKGAAALVDKALSADIALAAERAKVTKLVEVERAARKLEENLGVKGVDVGSLRVDLYRALAAITEAQEK